MAAASAPTASPRRAVRRLTRVVVMRLISWSNVVPSMMTLHSGLRTAVEARHQDGAKSPSSVVNAVRRTLRPDEPSVNSERAERQGLCASWLSCGSEAEGDA